MSSSPVYSERLAVPVRWWALGTLFVATLWLAMVVAMPARVAWLVAAVLMVLLAAWFVGWGSARVVVADGVLRAGRAHIAAEHLGAAQALDPDEARRAAGPDADARAYLLLRPYLKRAVRVEITDPADPAPYWLLGSRRPRELERALNALTHAG